MNSLHRIRSHPSIVAIVAIAGLPYMSSRCIDALTCECSLTTTVHEAQSDADRARGNRHGHHTSGHCASDADQGDDGSEPAPHHTCCQLTASCAGEVMVGVPSGPPPAAALMALPIVAHTKVVVVSMAKRVVDPTHHPPPYIRFATLLI